MIITLKKTFSWPELRTHYLNLTDDNGRSYGREFPAHISDFVVIDHNGNNFFVRKPHRTQIWDSKLGDWYRTIHAKIGDVISVAFDSEEQIDGYHVLHLKISSSNEFLTPLASDIAEPTLPTRHAVKTYRILRDTALAHELKQSYSFECQLCGFTIELPNGERYAEVHHIKPLGEPHNGFDEIDNMLVLCPNHHAMCDLGAIRLSLGDIIAKQLDQA